MEFYSIVFPPYYICSLLYTCPLHRSLSCSWNNLSAFSPGTSSHLSSRWLLPHITTCSFSLHWDSCLNVTYSEGATKITTLWYHLSTHLLNFTSCHSSLLDIICTPNYMFINLPFFLSSFPREWVLWGWRLSALFTIFVEWRTAWANKRTEGQVWEV